MDDTGLEASYSNFCRVTATPEEVILDFGLNMQPFATGGQHVKANQRIVMNFYTTKRLLAAIGTTIQRHEQTFWVRSRLDIRRQPPRRCRGKKAGCCRACSAQRGNRIRSGGLERLRRDPVTTNR